MDAPKRKILSVEDMRGLMAKKKQEIEKKSKMLSMDEMKAAYQEKKKQKELSAPAPAEKSLKEILEEHNMRTYGVRTTEEKNAKVKEILKERRAAEKVEKPSDISGISKKSPYAKLKFDSSFNKPYIFKYNAGKAYSSDVKVIMYGMMMTLVSLFEINTVKTGHYYDVAYFRPPLSEIFKVVGYDKDNTPKINKDIFGIDKTALYFDLTATTDAEEVKGETYKTLLPPAGEEYGAKVDIQMYPDDYKRDPKDTEDNEMYLRLTLVDEEDEKRLGSPWNSHFRTYWGKSDDSDLDRHWEFIVRNTHKLHYEKFIRSYSGYFIKYNKPLWDKLDARFMKYV